MGSASFSTSPGRHRQDRPVTWTAPHPTPVDGPLTGPDRPMLEGYLGWQRATLLNICAGLTGEQLAAPSAAVLAAVPARPGAAPGQGRADLAAAAGGRPGRRAAVRRGARQGPRLRGRRAPRTPRPRWPGWSRSGGSPTRPSPGCRSTTPSRRTARRSRCGWSTCTCAASTRGTTATPTCSARASTGSPRADRPRSAARCLGAGAARLADLPAARDVLGLLLAPPSRSPRVSRGGSWMVSSAATARPAAGGRARARRPARRRTAARGW